VRFKDRRDGIRSEAVGRRVSGEVPIFEFADAAVQRAGPRKAIAALINSIGTVLGESVCLCIALARYRTVAKL